MFPRANDEHIIEGYSRGLVMDPIILNQSDLDRRIRAVVAVLLLASNYFLDLSTGVSQAALIVAAILLFNAVSGNCYIYRMFGYSSCPIPDSA